MKCPHCDYKDGWNWEGDNVDDYVETKGDAGPFWELAVKMERNVGHDWHNDGSRKAELCACPKCKKTFIEE